MKRRDVLKSLTMLPLAGGVIESLVPQEASAAPKTKAAPKRDFFKELGVTPMINAAATMTFLSGSLMQPETLEAIQSTSQSFANMYELQDKAGAKIAEMLKVEAAMVTSGAACALTLGTAACITGTNAELIALLPNIPGPQREVIMQKSHRYLFDHAVRNCGVKIVEVEGPDEMDKAFNSNTVMALFFNAAGSHSVEHAKFVEICKKHTIPSFIDAAADVPPVDNLFAFQKIGFDMITFSGGKMMHGPQSTGVFFGRKDLIEAAKLNHSPYECPIGRPMKVNKEEIFGMYAALKSYIERDHAKEWQMWLDRIKVMGDKLASIPTLKSETSVSKGPANAFPGMNVTWDQSKIKMSPKDVSQALLKGTPSIVVNASKSALHVGVVLLKPEQVDIVAGCIKAVLQKAAV